MKFDTGVFLGKSVEKIRVSLNLTRITGTLYEDQYTFRLSLSFLLGMKNVSDKCCTEYENTHFMFNKSFRK